ncbi:CBS domain-containing protein [Thauera aromatica]|uniref:CBS domain protein n=1 Tax=Thauera aromatica K172 TaxID=44139 RepID=A0A2R4BNZ1_THAAR|nr:CBS domain-containing protein [Thauera aromatica]AVR89066.1 CBS domain protein [Thauera aromatica K172]MCK2096674.1 CBS domain-containing protein [Thauera aromatica]
MLSSLLVKDYMIGDHLAFTARTDLLKAVHTLLEHGLSGAPVVDENNRLIGFLSERDCLKATLDASYFRHEAGEVQEFMSRDVSSIAGDASVIDAIQMFLANPHRCLPVVEGSRLIGQLSRADILKGLEKLRRDGR